MSLSDYILDTSALLHDGSNLFTSKSQLTRWINETRRQIARQTGCVRRLIAGQSAFGANSQPGDFIPGAAQPGALPGNFPSSSSAAVVGAAVNSLQTIPGVERYGYVGFFNPYAQQTYAGIKGIVDIIALSVNWGGAVRPSLNWAPWEDLQAYARAYATLVTSYPYWWSVYNDGEMGEVWLFPAPSTAGDIEADASCVPADLYSDDDFDAIPGEFHNVIKYGAAALAMMSKRNYLDAQIMDAKLFERTGVSVVARDRGKTRSFYYSDI